MTLTMQVRSKERTKKNYKKKKRRQIWALIKIIKQQYKGRKSWNEKQSNNKIRI